MRDFTIEERKILVNALMERGAKLERYQYGDSAFYDAVKVQDEIKNVEELVKILKPEMGEYQKEKFEKQKAARQPFGHVDIEDPPVYYKGDDPEFD